MKKPSERIQEIKKEIFEKNLLLHDIDTSILAIIQYLDEQKDKENV